MSSFGRSLRIAGYAVGAMFVAWLLWVAVVGPAALILLRPR
ncbi:MAG TPA: hypothetical protein VI384_05045 [Candidatus Dormibacteraeota bacterium]